MDKKQRKYFPLDVGHEKAYFSFNEFGLGRTQRT